jgi:hypothetical protein
MRSYNPFKKSTTPTSTTTSTSTPTPTSTTQDSIGNANFFDFLCAVFSRIAYTEAPLSLFLITGVCNIITQNVLEKFNVENPDDVYDEDKIFNLSGNNPYQLPTRNYNGKMYVDFSKYAERINALIEDTINSKDYTTTTNQNITIIDIADSNYGDTIVIKINFMKFIFVVYRGTYSSKTASSYASITSIVPMKIGGFNLLKGIAKIELETSYTVTDAIIYLASTPFSQSPSVGGADPSASEVPKILPKVVFSGHSLGGGLATTATLVFTEDGYFLKPTTQTDVTKQNSLYPLIHYSPMCITFGSPRVLGYNAAIEICDWITNPDVESKIIFHRYSNNGDPVTALPPKGPTNSTSFFHPCSTDKIKRQMVARDCKSAMIARPIPKVNYDSKINCTNDPSSMGYLTTITSKASANPLDHVEYLFISFIKAADVLHLAKSAVTITTTEISRVTTTNNGVSKGDTEIRIIKMSGNNETGKYYDIFADLKNIEDQQKMDVYDTSRVFTDLLKLNDVNDESNINVTFTDKTNNNKETIKIPNSFPKKADDNSLIDLTSQYKTDLQAAKQPIASQGGKRSKKRSKRKTNRKRRISKRRKRKYVYK